MLGNICRQDVSKYKNMFDSFRINIKCLFNFLSIIILNKKTKKVYTDILQSKKIFTQDAIFYYSCYSNDYFLYNKKVN